tara:strand:- start:452 stop:667 length:216 start_codon:yes stop_codon:yes gene_type:complete
MVNIIILRLDKNSPYFKYKKQIGFIMKNNKFFFIILSLIVFSSFLVITYLDIPAPDKLETKNLDVNDEKVK